MPVFVRAIAAKRLLAFPAFAARTAVDAETVVFLHEDGSVTEQIFRYVGVLYEDPAGEWKDFLDGLQLLRPPDWEAEEQAAAQSLGEGNAKQTA